MPGEQAIRSAKAFADQGVTWFEELVSSDDLAGLASVKAASDLDGAAGEYGYDLAYFERMVAADAVDVLQVDVSRCADHRVVAGGRRGHRSRPDGWRILLEKGERCVFALRHSRRWDPLAKPWSEKQARRRLDDTATAWRSWSELHQRYQGPAQDLVHLSGRCCGA